MSISTRKEVAAALHLATKFYLIKKGYSVHHEVGVESWGARRADVFAFNTKHDIIICEVKSCAADFDTDTKFHTYLPYCHVMYFCIDQSYWESKACSRLVEKAKAHGAGVLVLGQYGTMESKVKARRRPSVAPGFLKKVITKLAWRLGSHRGNTRAHSVKLTR